MKNILFLANHKHDIEMASSISGESIDVKVHVMNLNLITEGSISRIEDKLTSIGAKSYLESLYKFLQTVSNKNLRMSTLKDIFNDIEIETFAENTIVAIEKTLIDNSIDMICISCYAIYLQLYLFITFFLREKYNNIDIVWGGPEIDESDYLCLFLDKNKILYSREHPAISVRAFLGLKPIADLKDMLLPSLSDEYKKYLDYKLYIKASIGCYNKCKFCVTPSCYRYKYISFYDLLKYMYSNHDIKTYYLQDATLNRKKDFEYFIDEIAKTDIIIEASYITMDIQDNILEKMTKRNFKILRIGLECLDEELAIKINKKMPGKKDIKRKLQIINDNGIVIIAFYIVGLPGQTEDIFKREFDFIKEIKSELKNIKIMPLPYFLCRKSYIYKNYIEFSQIQNKADKLFNDSKLLRNLKSLTDESYNNFIASEIEYYSIVFTDEWDEVMSKRMRALEALCGKQA